MMYRGYIGKVEFDEQAKLLHGDVVGIRDVITFEAESIAQIEKAFHDSVDDYLAFCAERGEKPEKPASGKFVARVGVALHRQLAMLAQYRGISLNAVVELLLQKEVAAELDALASSSARPQKRSLRASGRHPASRAPAKTRRKTSDAA